MAHRVNKYPNMTQTTIFGEKKENSFSSESNTVKTMESSLKSARTTLATSDMPKKTEKVIHTRPIGITPLPVQVEQSKAAENNNLVKQNPAGKIFLKRKNKIFDKPLKRPKKNQQVYYS